LSLTCHRPVLSACSDELSKVSCRSCLIPAVLIAFLPWLSRTVPTWLIKNLRMNKNQRKKFLFWKRRILLSKIKTIFAFLQFFVFFITFRKL
jgi:hypothetical protein